MYVTLRTQLSLIRCEGTVGMCIYLYFGQSTRPDYI